MDKNLVALEFDKILELLCLEVSDDRSKEEILSLRPESNIDKVRCMLQETYDAYTLSVRFGSPSFSGIHDINFSISRVKSGGVLSALELLNIAGNLRIIRKLKEWRKNSSEIKTSLDNMFDVMTSNKYLEDMITEAIISEDEISDDASLELKEIRRKIKARNSSIREQLDKMIRSTFYQKYLQDPIVTIRNERFVIPVKSEYKNEVSGLVHDMSSSGSTLFIEPIGVVKDNNEVKTLRAEEKKEIEKILKNFSLEVLRFSDDIISSYKQLVCMNVIFAKASMAYKMRASLPIMNTEGRINLKRARHPLIDSSRVIPIDIELGKNFDTLVITGPNTGGKTVTLKITGLLSCMAMCGLMIPAYDDSELSIFDNILVDIGDEQSIEQSLSTFSSHIKNIINIMDKCSKKSLVLLDEVGAGTDPVEGASLAESILEEFRIKGCRIVATTHYKELKEYALRTEGVENACCEFDVETMKPTYKLLIGVPGSSNAFLIAEKLGMSVDVTKRARILTGNKNGELDKVIRELEESRRSLEREREEANRMYKLSVDAKTEAEKKYNSLKSEEDKIIEKAREEAQRILSRVRAQSDMIISELESIRKRGLSITSRDMSSVKSGIRKIEDIADPIKKYENTDKPQRDFKVGDRVVVLGINKEAVVLSEKDSSGNMLVQVGSIKTKVSVKSLKFSDKKIETPKIKGGVSRRVTSNSNKKVSMDIDLRGRNALDAIAELDIFIDSCVMSGIHQATIIHGKGTGTLRREIHSHLKKHRSISNYRIGGYGEGELGATIIEIK